MTTEFIAPQNKTETKNQDGTQVLSEVHAPDAVESANNALTLLELIEITLYTVRKINNYPKSFGKTVENYFHLLFPDEVKAHLVRRAVNRKTGDIISVSFSQKTKHRALDLSVQTQQVRDIRALCRLLIEQQENVMLLISDKLDELEADLSTVDAEGVFVYGS